MDQIHGIQFLQWPQIFENFFATKGKKISKEAQSWFYNEVLSEAHLFLMPNRIEEKIPEFLVTEAPLDLPFRTCVFECLEDITQDVLVHHKTVTRIRFNFLGVHEISPGKYHYFGAGILAGESGHTSTQIFFAYDSDKDDPKVIYEIDLMPFTNGALAELMKGRIGICLEELNRNDYELGRMIATRPKIKAKLLGEKRFIKVKPITIVRPKKICIESHAAYRNVDWSHRWEVRGHWRRIEGLGKNREGAYEIKGFTWVKNHIKGPENATLIKKARLVNVR